MANITKANEDYLEAIYVLQKDGISRSVDVANYLGISKPAVSIATNSLIEKGLIEKESYGDITLTKEGETIALSILEKHKLIFKWLISIGVSEPTAKEECCKLEHILSTETINCLKTHFIK